MDEDVMTKSSYGKVIFNAVEWTQEALICQFYPKYIYEDVKTSVTCAVGLYRVPHVNPDDYLMKQEIFVVLKSLGEDIQLKFKRANLPFDDDSFYIFQFMNEKGEVMGVSTPFKIQIPSSPTGSHDHDSAEFVVIDPVSMKSNNDKDFDNESLCSNVGFSSGQYSFVVLSEKCKSLVEGSKTIPAMSESVFSMAESVSSEQTCETNRESFDKSSITSHKSVSEKHGETDKCEKRDENVYVIERLSEDNLRIKNLLQKANETIQKQEMHISVLSEEIRTKNKKIEELESLSIDKENKKQKEFAIKEFQTLNKSSQLKIYELEKKIQKMDKEMQKLSTSSHSEIEDIRKSLNELETSVIVERPSSSPVSSISYLDSLVIQSAMSSSESEFKNTNEKNLCGGQRDEESEVGSSSNKSSEQAKILDNGKVIFGHACPICGKIFEVNDDASLLVHTNNHLSTDTLACPLCDLIFEVHEEKNLEEHVNSHFESDNEPEIQECGGSENSGETFKLNPIIRKVMDLF